MSPPAPPVPVELPGVPVQAGYKVLLVPQGYSAVLLPDGANPSTPPQHSSHPSNDPSSNYTHYSQDGTTHPSSIPTLPAPQSMISQLHDPVQRPKTPTHIPQPAAAPTTPAKKIPRPHNSFMTYRADKHKEVLEKNAGKSSKDVSKLIAEMWKNEPPEVQEFYKRKADEGRAEHKVRLLIPNTSMSRVRPEDTIWQLKYPDYKYSPNKKKKHHQTDSTHQGGVQKKKPYSRSAPSSRSASRTASPMPDFSSRARNRSSGRNPSFNILNHFNSAVNLGSEDTNMDNPDGEMTMTMSPVGSPSAVNPNAMFGSQSARASPVHSVASSHYSLASSYYSVGSSHYSVASSHYSGHSRGRRRSFRSNPTSRGTSVCDSPVQREEWAGGEWAGDGGQAPEQQAWDDGTGMDLFSGPKSAPAEGDYVMQGPGWSGGAGLGHFVAEADAGFLGGGQYGGHPAPGTFEGLQLGGFDGMAANASMAPAFDSHPFFQPPPAQHSKGVDPDELSRAIAALSGVEGLVNLDDDRDGEGSDDNEASNNMTTENPNNNNTNNEFESLGLGYGVDFGGPITGGHFESPQRQQFQQPFETLQHPQFPQQHQPYPEQHLQFYPQQFYAGQPIPQYHTQRPFAPYPAPYPMNFQQQPQQVQQQQQRPLVHPSSRRQPLPQQGGPGKQLLTLADFNLLAKSLQNVRNDDG
ncbi:hypothetical protein HK097_009515 [Rhizophlyctis rosea]|uniref:HMG box domain-containing protein n=1 Tax=Rhizophlyctis rosea TaxID=64517 RepID=A0AAD5X365_9FUNG|nr:hypothetical protein HK097_009515 [Rhizophlyctis rosea]